VALQSQGAGGQAEFPRSDQFFNGFATCLQ
jgi:hypothetical protein